MQTKALVLTILSFLTVLDVTSSANIPTPTFQTATSDSTSEENTHQATILLVTSGEEGTGAVSDEALSGYPPSFSLPPLEGTFREYFYEQSIATSSCSTSSTSEEVKISSSHLAGSGSSEESSNSDLGDDNSTLSSAASNSTTSLHDNSTEVSSIGSDSHKQDQSSDSSTSFSSVTGANSVSASSMGGFKYRSF